jgi:hypothetical protein
MVRANLDRPLGTVGEMSVLARFSPLSIICAEHPSRRDDVFLEILDRDTVTAWDADDPPASEASAGRERELSAERAKGTDEFRETRANAVDVAHPTRTVREQP